MATNKPRTNAGSASTHGGSSAGGRHSFGRDLRSFADSVNVQFKAPQREEYDDIVRTPRNRLKSRVGQSSVFFGVVGFVLFILAISSDSQFAWSSRFKKPFAGAPLLNMQYVTAIFSLWCGLYGGCLWYLKKVLEEKPRLVYIVSVALTVVLGIWSTAVCFTAQSQTTVSKGSMKTLTLFLSLTLIAHNAGGLAFLVGVAKYGREYQDYSMRNPTRGGVPDVAVAGVHAQPAYTSVATAPSAPSAPPADGASRTARNGVVSIDELVLEAGQRGGTGAHLSDESDGSSDDGGGSSDGDSDLSEPTEGAPTARDAALTARGGRFDAGPVPVAPVVGPATARSADSYATEHYYSVVHAGAAAAAPATATSSPAPAAAPPVPVGSRGTPLRPVYQQPPPVPAEPAPASPAMEAGVGAGMSAGVPATPGGFSVAEDVLSPEEFEGLWTSLDRYSKSFECRVSRVPELDELISHLEARHFCPMASGEMDGERKLFVYLTAAEGPEAVFLAHFVFNVFEKRLLVEFKGVDESQLAQVQRFELQPLFDIVGE